jgi:hypothetical protein
VIGISLHDFYFIPTSIFKKQTLGLIYIYIYIYIYITNVGWDSAVGRATCYGLESPGDRIPVGAKFSAPAQTGPEAHPAFCTTDTGSLPKG